MRALIISLFLVGFSRASIAQTDHSVNIKNMDGIWRFDEKSYSSFMLNKGNKSLRVSYWADEKNSYTYGFPYSYFGFWNKKSEYPKNISELDSAGNGILFYDNLGKSYDTSGNLIQYTRSCWVTYNENLDPGHEPAVLSFYYKSTPDIYVRTKIIPDLVLLSLKRNSKSWQKYIDFVGIIERKIKSTRAIIYSISRIPTKMYLVKGDDVEVQERKGEWIKIRYYGSRLIEGWVKVTDIEK